MLFSNVIAKAFRNGYCLVVRPRKTDIVCYHLHVESKKKDTNLSYKPKTDLWT